MKVFVDGSVGTTGLEIVKRLMTREDLTLVTLSEEVRKDPAARKDALLSADLAILCLPDEAAAEAVSFAAGSGVKIIDASTAHRTAPNFVYGFPELSGQRDKIRQATSVANPGCHASGFIALVAPLVKSGVLSRDAFLSCFSLTGYTGGGKKMIASYEGEEGATLAAPRQYATGQTHKHLPEMQAVTGITRAPIFLPVVAAFPRGMQVSVPLPLDSLTCGIEGVKEVYRDLYKEGGVVRYDDAPLASMPADALAGKDSMAVSVIGNAERIVAIATFDNLGKGASGAAIQNMNLMLGAEETLGLNL